MPNLTLLAHIHAEPAQTALVRAALMALIAPTRAEAGCIQYDLHQSNTDPAHFFFYEIWATRDHWQAHMQSPHILANGPATKGAIASVVLHEMTLIG